ncbi:hypothetical protein FACS1894201_10240 [Bacteroidia bacterium]|nr:hypothetical protein FACS1894201_10240 [Bacteroidia bacterium]
MTESVLTSIVIIGYGNVGSHLDEALSMIDGYNVQCVEHRTLPFPNTNADLYIVAVPDDAISSVVSKIPQGKLWVHTSANFDHSAYGACCGAFYPLQTFTKDKSVVWQDVPIIIDTENDVLKTELNVMALDLTGRSAIHFDLEQRQTLHIAAVFANNFVNFFWHIADNILLSQNIDFDLLRPLIQETARKVMTYLPEQTQTGPAIRRDKNLIERQKELVKNINPHLALLYRILSEDIALPTIDSLADFGINEQDVLNYEDPYYGNTTH